MISESIVCILSSSGCHLVSIKCNLSFYSVETTWMERDEHTRAGQSNAAHSFAAMLSSAARHKLLPYYLAALFVDNDEMSAAG